MFYLSREIEHIKSLAVDTVLLSGYMLNLLISLNITINSYRSIQDFDESVKKSVFEIFEFKR